MHISDLFRWTFLIVTNCVTSSFECDINCSKLKHVPPRWNYNGTVVPIYAYECLMNSSCHLDIGELLRNNTDNDKTNSSLFITVDLYIDCNGADLGKEIYILVILY